LLKIYQLVDFAKTVSDTAYFAGYRIGIRARRVRNKKL